MGFDIGGLIGGGGSGGIFGAIGGLVGGIFGGPIGAMLGKAIGNMVGEAVGSAVKDAVDTLQKEDGLPKYLAKEIKAAVDEAIDGLKDKSVDQGTQCECNDQAKGPMDDFVKDLTKSILDAVRQAMDEEVGKKGKGGRSAQGGATGGQGAGQSASQGGGEASGGQGAGASGGAGAADGAGTSGASEGEGSWIEAIAKAMGKVMGEKAAKMVKLSNDMAALGGGNDPEKAQQFSQMQAEFTGASQLFSMLQNGFANALKSIGEGLSQMARKG